MTLTLAVGIGANTAVFNFINALVLRPLPYRAPEQLVTLHETQRSKGSTFDPISPLNLRDWRREARGLEAVGAFRRSDYNLSVDERPEWVRGARVEAGLFPMLGVAPVLGRGFSPEEDGPRGENRVLLLSHALWQERFGSDPKVIGRKVILDGAVYQVVGVMPPRFGFPEWARLWTPLALDAESARRDERSLNAIARLSAGTTVAQAQSSLDGVARQLQSRYPESNRDSGVQVRRLGDELMPPEARLGLVLLLGAAAFVLLIICANSTSLLIVRVMARFRELAVRAALGAPRGRLLRQLILESLVIFLLAGTLAVGTSVAAVKLMLAAVPVEIPFWVRLDLDYRVLLFTLAVSLASGFAFSFLPALRVTRPDTLFQLREEGRGASAGARQSRLRKVLVAGELALAGALLICALLLVKSSRRMQEVDRGYRADHVLTCQFSLTGTGYEDAGRRDRFTERLLEQTRAIPGVVSAGAVDFLPSSNSGFQSASVVAEDRPVEPGQEITAARSAFSGSYLESLRIPLAAGRGFTADEEAEGKSVVIVGAGLAEKLWPGRPAVGRRLSLDAGPGEKEWLTVVGVAGDVHQGYQMGGIDQWPRQQLYLPLPRTSARTLTLTVRTAGPPEGTVSALRGAVQSLDPHLPIFHVMTLTEVQAELEWLPRFWSKMFSVFALLGLLIAAMGLFGIVSHTMAQRNRELAIRAALGARSSDLVLLPLKLGLRLASTGLVLGLVAAFGMAQLLQSMLYGVHPTDPTVYGGVSVLLLGIALLASLAPALRVLKLDPIKSLKAE
jgi:putative ABC transport system permease protein